VSALSQFLAEQADVDLQLSRRALAVSQRAWRGATNEVASGVSIAWHGSDRHPETGAVALVGRAGPLTELVGDIVRVVNRVGIEDREVFVYVYGTIDADVDISLTRRAFQELGLLASEALEGRVEVRAGDPEVEPGQTPEAAAAVYPSEDLYPSETLYPSGG
jgi:hypothetical protein